MTVWEEFKATTTQRCHDAGHNRGLLTLETELCEFCEETLKLSYAFMLESKKAALLDYADAWENNRYAAPVLEPSDIVFDIREWADWIPDWERMAEEKASGAETAEKTS